ncbi:integrase core domain-containing protein [Micromonospora phytophila]|uniref:integrase core domain-containing protein n=1 Tax=Micromonospora phytophila TaxID=709888 RepID=UPI00202F6DCA|nr:integrase core domain-containing protein [Micromonospora phytophila]MCM0673332.1 integrase core domain-containing protein [Micromonospora phytophila]
MRTSSTRTAPPTTNATLRAADLLNRDFTAARPNRCWVADFTHVAAWSGVVYVAFVVYVYSRAIVGLVRGDEQPDPAGPGRPGHGVVAPRPRRAAGRGGPGTSQRCAQYTSFRFTTHLLDAGIDASIGSVGDALDNALMESTIGLYKTELIKPRGPWRSLAQVELASAEWVDWYNNQRLHSAIGHVTPTEYESVFSAQPQSKVVGANR